jgi:hypothetical protein
MSIISAGDFSPSELQEIQLKAETIWADDVRKADYTAESLAAQAIIANQSATFTMLQDPDKDREVRVSWIQNCGLSVEDLGSECENGGTEAGSDSALYAITVEKEVAFTVSRNVMRTNVHDYQEVIARNFLEAGVALDEYIAQYAVAKLDDWSGTNVYEGPYNQSGSYTEIPAVSWTPNVLGYLSMVKRKNRFGNAYLLGGDLLEIQKWNAMMEQANAEGKGNANKMGSWNIYNDLFNVDSTLGFKGMFMVNNSSVAFVHKTRYSDVPQDMSKIGQTRYRIPSNSLQGVKYDVIYTMACESNDVKDQFKLIGRFDVLLNPRGCTAGRTGVLGFKCV